MGATQEILRKELRLRLPVVTLPTFQEVTSPPDRSAVVLAKKELRIEGPVLFIERHNTSYDSTPYLAIDQLAMIARGADPSRPIKRLQIFSGKERTDLVLWSKQINGSWRLEKIRAIVADETSLTLDCEGYWSSRGTSNARTTHEFSIKSEWAQRITTLGVDALTDVVSVIWPNPNDAPTLNREFSKILEVTAPAIVGCTGDSKVFAPLRELLQANRSQLEKSLVLLGGIHAINARDAVVHNEAMQISPVFDLIHTSPIGEHDFRKLLIAFNTQGEERLARLARLENFTTCVNRTSSNNDEMWFFPNPEISWSSIGVPKCPSSAQIPTSWGGEQTIVRRLKGAWGCQFSCSYCATAGNYKPGDIQAVEQFFTSVAEEIQTKRLDPTKVLVYFEDANFSGGFAKQVLALSKKFDFKLGVQIRYDCVMSLLPQLVEGHASYLFLGMEAYDDALRAGVNKQNKLSPSQMYGITKNLKNREIDFLISGIVGLPGEDIRSMARTIAFSRLQAPAVISLEVPKVYPNTPFATDYQNTTGLDPAELYTSGTYLIHTYEAGQETKGSLLIQSLSDKDAEHIMKQVDAFMQMDFDALWEFAGIELSYKPLGITQYIRSPNDLGFYRRVS